MPPGTLPSCSRRRQRQYSRLTALPSCRGRRRHGRDALALVRRMGYSARRPGAERSSGDPGPPQTETVPGLQRTATLRVALRRARDTAAPHLMLDLSPDEWIAIRLSLKIALVASAVALPFGIALAWLLARKIFWGKTLLDGLVHMPLVLPPVVTGYLLLISFGRRGPIGAFLADHFGIVFSFRWTGAALSCGVMGFPLLVRPIRLAIEAIDRKLEDPAASLGASGAGKTTLVNMIAGLLPPDRGCIRLDDTVLFDSAARIDVPAHRRRIGYVFQEGRLFPHLSVAANLDYGRRMRGLARDGAETARIVNLLDIGHLLDRRPGKRSGGERQRVAFGRALLMRPRLLLLDEPLASLDAARKREILPYLQKLRDEVPMVYVSHHAPELKRIATSVVLLEAGRVVATGGIDVLDAATAELVA